MLVGGIEPVAIDCGMKTIRSWVHKVQVVVPKNLTDEGAREWRERVVVDVVDVVGL